MSKGDKMTRMEVAYRDHLNNCYAVEFHGRKFWETLFKVAP